MNLSYKTKCTDHPIALIVLYTQNVCQNGFHFWEFVRHFKEITSSRLRCLSAFWLQFGVITASVRHSKATSWLRHETETESPVETELRQSLHEVGRLGQPRGDSAPRILCLLIRPPANFRQSFAYFRAILCEPFSQKSRFFLVQRNFPLYTRGLLGCLLGFWPSGPKPCGGNNGLWSWTRQSVCQSLFKKDRPMW